MQNFFQIKIANYMERYEIMGTVAGMFPFNLSVDSLFYQA